MDRRLPPPGPSRPYDETRTPAHAAWVALTVALVVILWLVLS